jgi:hypothetical protein
MAYEAIDSLNEKYRLKLSPVIIIHNGLPSGELGHAEPRFGVLDPKDETLRVIYGESINMVVQSFPLLFSELKGRDIVFLPSIQRCNSITVDDSPFLTSDFFDARALTPEQHYRRTLLHELGHLIMANLPQPPSTIAQKIASTDLGHDLLGIQNDTGRVHPGHPSPYSFFFSGLSFEVSPQLNYRCGSEAFAEIFALRELGYLSQDALKVDPILASKVAILNTLLPVATGLHTKSNHRR